MARPPVVRPPHVRPVATKLYLGHFFPTECCRHGDLIGKLDEDRYETAVV